MCCKENGGGWVYGCVVRKTVVVGCVIKKMAVAGCVVKKSLCHKDRKVKVNPEPPAKANGP